MNSALKQAKTSSTSFLKRNHHLCQDQPKPENTTHQTRKVRQEQWQNIAPKAMTNHSKKRTT